MQQHGSNKLTSRHPLTYLVEFFDPLTLELMDSDVCAKLSVAIEKVYLHLKEFPEVQVLVEVSHDFNDEIDGVGFFGVEKDLLSCVTVYHLERDTEETSILEIEQACQKGGEEFSAKLNAIFRNK